MLVVERMRVRRPRLMGLDGGQQSEPPREAEKRLHALMLRPVLEKSSLGLARSWSQTLSRCPSWSRFTSDLLRVSATHKAEICRQVLECARLLALFDGQVIDSRAPEDWRTPR